MDMKSDGVLRVAPTAACLSITRLRLCVPKLAATLASHLGSPHIKKLRTYN
jgi:hypothetical protein